MKKNPEPEKTYLDEIKEVYDFMIKNNLDVVEIGHGDDYIKLARKTQNQIQILPINTNATSTSSPQSVQQIKNQSQQTQIQGLTIKAPISGIFYRSPSPSSPPYVREGDNVEANSIICLIEAMKVFNEIKSEFKCKILKCIAENGKFVNEGDDLFLIEKL
ncbi:MAG: acetyl-CoA carboxylase biotin carboxyl carrier protein subunit [Elusimicrobiales bacterium]|nr:acetyl-CoA carboxylase biotin carboxyl carrier protein subunit [Elusimicrobiales bacterium]